MPQAGATIVLLNLHAWNYPSKPSTALTKFAGRPDDVLLVAVCKPPDLLTFSYGDCDATLVTAGYCTVPYPGVDKVKVKVNTGRRLGEETPSASVAKVKAPPS